MCTGAMVFASRVWPAPPSRFPNNEGRRCDGIWLYDDVGCGVAIRSYHISRFSTLPDVGDIVAENWFTLYIRVPPSAFCNLAYPFELEVACNTRGTGSSLLRSTICFWRGICREVVSMRPYYTVESLHCNWVRMNASVSDCGAREAHLECILLEIHFWSIATVSEMGVRMQNGPYFCNNNSQHGSSPVRTMVATTKGGLSTWIYGTDLKWISLEHDSHDDLRICVVQ